MHNVLQVGPAGQEHVQHPGPGQGVSPQVQFALGVLVDRGPIPEQAVRGVLQGGGNL